MEENQEHTNGERLLNANRFVFKFQVLESLPWDKVDIRVISLEICRGKLNDALKDRHEDNYPGIITLLESKGFKEVHSVAHTDEAISYEVIFAKSDLKLNY